MNETMSETVAGQSFQDENVDEWKKLGQKSWDKMIVARLKDGFVDGKYLSEEKALQSGFNEGYQAGFQTSYKVAVLKGVIGAVTTSLKESNPEHLERAQKLGKEISELERNCVEMKKKVVISKESHSLDTILFDCSESDDTSPNSIHTSATNQHSYVLNSLKVEKQFNILKESAVQFLEECGYTLLTKIIVNI